MKHYLIYAVECCCGREVGYRLSYGSDAKTTKELKAQVIGYLLDPDTEDRTIESYVEEMEENGSIDMGDYYFWIDDIQEISEQDFQTLTRLGI